MLFILYLNNINTVINTNIIATIVHFVETLDTLVISISLSPNSSSVDSTKEVICPERAKTYCLVCSK